jgi:hypothetical protein
LRPRESCSQTGCTLVYQPKIVVVGQGRKRGYLGDEVYTYDPFNYLLMRSGSHTGPIKQARGILTREAAFDVEAG